VLPQVRTRHPQAYLAGEVIHGDYRQIIATTGLDAVTQYELWKGIWSSLNDRNLFERAWALRRHNDFQQSFRPLTFVGNHDVTRIASKLDDDRHLALALVVLFTVGGTPSIYAGDEQAFRGIKEQRPGGDDEIRPVFPAGPEGLAPHGWPVYRLHQQLAGFRRHHSWLHDATTTVVSLGNRLLAYRAAAGDQAIVAALNVDDQPRTVPLGAPFASRLHASSPPADPAVLKVPATGGRPRSRSPSPRSGAEAAADGMRGVPQDPPRLHEARTAGWDSVPGCARSA
jgi:cyclomaltodextrinase